MTDVPRPLKWVHDRKHLILIGEVLSRFPHADPTYAHTVAWRFLDNDKVPLQQAVKAVRRGYTEVSAARCDGVIA